MGAVTQNGGVTALCTVSMLSQGLHVAQCVLCPMGMCAGDFLLPAGVLVSSYYSCCSSHLTIFPLLLLHLLRLRTLL